jgi:threonine dehydrogenase-like Zn-dependent dehydrogenase
MTEARNRVVQVRRFGGPDGVEVVDAPLPTAGRGEVRVRVLASGLEYTDVLIRRHLYPQTMHRRPPFVLGYNVVGEIDQLGDGVSGFQVGERVADMTVVGSNACYCTLRADRLTRVPAGLDAVGGGHADLELDDRVPAAPPRGPGAADACSCMEPPVPSVRRCSSWAGWPASSCGALRAARMRR